MNSIKHVAIIMDGNGRWGIKHKKSRNLGHKQGLKTVEEIIKANKIAQNEGAYKSKALKDAKGYRVARLPNIIVHQLAKKGILTLTGQVLDKPRFFKWLNDSDNRHFRIYTGNL